LYNFEDGFTIKAPLSIKIVHSEPNKSQNPFCIIPTCYF